MAIVATRAKRSGSRARSTLALGGLGLAAVLGVVGSISPSLALAGLVAAVVVPAAVLFPKPVIYLLVATVFAEAVTLGGVTVGRLTAPIALIAFLSQALNAPVRLREARPTMVAVGGYAMIALASVAWSVNVGASGQALGSLAICLVYMAAFAVLVRDPADLRRVLWAVVISAMVLALFWLVEYASGADRTANPAGDPNFVAAFLVMSLPLILVMASAARSGLGRAALLATVAIVAASVISTLSRTGLAALILALLLTMVLPVRTLQSSPTQKVAFLLSAMIGLALIVPTAGPALLQRFRESNYQGAIGGRGDLWRAAWQGYREHPLTGLGYGGFKGTSFTLLASTPGVYLRSHVRFVDTGEYVHDAYLGTLAELGPVGLLFFLGIYGAVARSLRRTAREARRVGQPFIRAVCNALFIGLISFALSSLLLSSETSRPFWMLVGLGLALPGVLTHAVRKGAAPERLGRSEGESQGVHALSR
jgi:O-antigen ligase